MTDFFREVDEDVRRDRALEFWSRYQGWFIALAVLIVAGAAGWRYYETVRVRDAEAAGAIYENALRLSREGKPAEAAHELAAISITGPAGYRVLARLRAAGEIADGDPAAGLKAFDALAGDVTLGPVLQDVARLRGAMLALGGADDREMAARLDPLSVAGAPFRSTARELRAVSALKHDDYATAGRVLNEMVTDAATPSGARGRAEALLGLVRGAKGS